MQTQELQLVEVQDSKVNSFVLLALLFIFLPSVVLKGLNIFSLYVITPALFLYAFIKNPRLVFDYKPLTYFTILFLWFLLTMVKSADTTLSFTELKKVLGVFLLCYIFIYFGLENIAYIHFIYFLYIVKFFVVFIYGINHGLEEATNERFSMDELNANYYGYYGFFTVISAFFIWQGLKHIRRLKNLLPPLYIIAIFGSVMACFYAASRAGIAISLTIAASFILIYYFYPFSKRYFWGIMLIIIVVMILVPVLNHYYQNSFLQKRMVIEDIKEESRYELISRAIQVGLQNPIFGVGPGNFIRLNDQKAFSHCSYTELFANNGIIGLLIYLIILKYFYKRNWQLYQMSQDGRKQSFYFYSFILLFTLYNFFYVFYTSLFLLAFFFLVLVHVEQSINHEEELQEEYTNQGVLTD